MLFSLHVIVNTILCYEYILDQFESAAVAVSVEAPAIILIGRSRSEGCVFDSH